MRVDCDPSENSFPAKIQSIHYAGSQVRYMVLVNGQKMNVVVYGDEDCDFKKDEDVYISLQENAAVVLPKDRELYES